MTGEGKDVSLEKHTTLCGVFSSQENSVVSPGRCHLGLYTVIHLYLFVFTPVKDEDEMKIAALRYTSKSEHL